jgi:WD40 repeat protein
MRLPRFALRRLTIAAALIVMALVSIVIYQSIRSADPSRLAAGQARTLEAKQRRVLNGTGESLAWNPTGTILATYFVELATQSAILIDLRRGARRVVLPHVVTTQRLTWSPDGKMLATGSPNRTATVWEAGTDKRLLTLSGHTERVNDLAWSPDGQTLATSACDHLVILWDTKSGKAQSTLKGHSSPVGDVRWSPDGRRIAADSYGSTLVWAPPAESPQTTLVGGWPRWSPDGKNLVTLSGNTAIVWDANTLKERGRLAGHKNFIEGLEWSPDGKLLATSTGDPGGFWRGLVPDGFLEPGADAIIWDATTLKSRWVLKDHRHNISSITWSPDGRFLATGSWDQSVIIWNVSTGKRAAKLTEGLDEVINSVAWSPDGKFLAATAGSFSNRTLIWEIIRAQTGAK